MIESSKCRSGRERDLIVLTRPSGLGGESPRSFGDEEGVTSEHTADVVLPSDVRATLEVVQAQLALEGAGIRLGAV